MWRVWLTIFKQNQQFRTFDIIVLALLIGAVRGAIGGVLGGSLHDNRISRAQAAVEALAKQIGVQRTAHFGNQAGMGRMPASVIKNDPSENEHRSAGSVPLTSGEMGKDPWGNPFRYRVINRTPSSKQKIFVWSSGPNGVFDSRELTETGSREDAIQFFGDDVGFVQVMAQEN